ncbi:MAG: alpha/beta hydrolase [Anaerobacillus sp.]
MWKQEYIKTDRGVFEVFSKGNGPPLCVTHLYSEYNESGDYFAESFVDSHTVFLVNLKEAGRSARIVEPYEYLMIETVFDLESIRTALEIDRWVFAGHSTGGMLACVYGIYASSSLEALIIVGAAAREYASNSSECIYHQEHPNYHLMQNYIETLKDPELMEKERRMIVRERTKLSLYKPELYENYFSKPIHKKMATNRMNFFAREILQFDVTKQLPNVPTPSLIMCGKHDVQCPLLYSREMAESIPGAILAIFNESNHYPFLEEGEAFNQTVKRFLNKIG